MSSNFFTEFLDSIGIDWRYLVNGLIGGIILSIYKKTKFLDSLRQVFIGGVISGYLTPVIQEKSSLGLGYVGFLSFVCGLSGMAIVDGLYKWVVKIIKKWKEAVIIVNTPSKPDTKDSE